MSHQRCAGWLGGKAEFPCGLEGGCERRRVAGRLWFGCLRFSDLIGLITRISDHIFRNEEEVRKGIGEVMGGHVLELESEKRARLMAEAKEQDEALGREQGMAQGMAQGEE